MQKKILVIALCLLAVVFLTVACNKNKEQDNDYVPIDYTTDEAGEKYVTNIYGDLAITEHMRRRWFLSLHQPEPERPSSCLR